MAYGTPRAPDEIEAYYTDIRRGRPPTRRAARRPDPPLRGDRRHLAARRAAPRPSATRCRPRSTSARPATFVVELGLKHADPKIEDGVAALAAGGVERDRRARARPALLGAVDRRVPRPGRRRRRRRRRCRSPAIESWATEPAYVDFLAAEVRRRLGGAAGRHQVVFTAHSLPRADPRRRRPVPRRAARDGGRGRRRRSGSRRRRSGRSPGSRPAARPSRGSAPTSSPSSTTLAGRRTPTACSSARAASSPTTSRCSTTSTSRPAGRADAAGPGVRPDGVDERRPGRARPPSPTASSPPRR